MAPETRHAAWQDVRRFSVRLLPEEGDPTELVGGIGDFLDAVDFAVDWLAREDPDRTGTASLAIFEARNGTAEKVWAYPPDSPDGAPLTKIFGFDPVNWKSAAAEFAPPREPAKGTFFPRVETETKTAPAPTPSPKSALPAPRALPVPPPPTPPPAVVPLRPPTPAVVPLRPPTPAVVAVTYEDRPEPTTEPRHLDPRRALAAAWDDRVARACLCLATVSLWLALALSSATVLVLFFVALSGLWWRRDKLVGDAKADLEDWL
jgi:hypothetical protein